MVSPDIPSSLNRRPPRDTGFRYRPVLRLAVGALVLTGVVLIGQGGWIKAKAVLSQVLLNQAFERAIERTAPAAEQPPADDGDVVPPAFHQVSNDTVLPAVSALPDTRPASDKPWPWADMKPLARIEAPHLGESAIVLDDVSGEALAFGPGHVGGTPLPGGEGTSVLAGHRDTHFEWIRHLKPGDTLSVTLTNGQRHEFSMRRAWIARHDASGIDPHARGRLLALATCWPFDAKTQGPMRYIVELELAAEEIKTAEN